MEQISLFVLPGSSEEDEGSNNDCDSNGEGASEKSEDSNDDHDSDGGSNRQQR